MAEGSVSQGYGVNYEISHEFLLQFIENVVILYMQYLLIIILYALSTPIFAQIELSEVCPANVKSAVDEFGQSSDWIELHNTSASTVNLAGYMLTDRALKPDKFVFGDVDIAAGDYLLVWASNRDLGNNLNWDTLIDYGQQMQYYTASAAPASDWRALGYDASSWQLGASPLGQGYSHINTNVSTQRVAVRIEFTLTAQELVDLEQLRFHLDYDDGFVAHLNGVEIARDNLGIFGVNPQWLADAPSQHTGRLQWGGDPDDFRVEAPLQLLVEGANVLTVEVHSVSNDGTLSLTPFLSIGKKHSAVPGNPSSYIDFAEDTLHAGFALSSSGEEVVLADAGGAVLDSFTYPQLWADQTYGYDAAHNLVIFQQATPDAANSATGFADVVGAVTISPDGGAYSLTQTVSLGCLTAGADIWYTLDGTEPAANGASSVLYTAPFDVSPPAVNPVVGVRAIGVVNGWWPSRIKTTSFLFNLQHDMKVWSIVTDPYYMWDPNEGIYSNFQADLEQPFHVELFEDDGTKLFASDVGAKIHGGATRSNAQKTLAIVFRGAYGESQIPIPFFGDDKPSVYNRLLLRNSGQDWMHSFIRDGLAHLILSEADLDVQGFQPSVVYINGQYWGIHNIRERMDKFYTKGNHYVDEDNIDLLELSGWGVHEGDNDIWFELLNYIASNPLSDPIAYEAVKSRIDVESFADYIIAEVFMNNQDWPHNNVKYWRSRELSGKWRFLFYDCDGGVGNWGLDASFDKLALALGGGFTATDLFNDLLQSPEFEQLFLNRYAEYLATSFDRSRTTNLLRKAARGIYPEINDTYIRWGGSPAGWRNEIFDIFYFLRDRVAYARSHVVSHFGTGGQAWTLTTGAWPPTGGSVKLAAISVSERTSIPYWQGVPVTITAVAEPGFEFERWSDSTLPQQPTIEIPPSNRAVGAIFKVVQMPAVAVINEINYNSSVVFDPADWVEVHNPGDSDFDLDGYELRDNNDAHQYFFPQGTIIPAHGYVVICQDLAAFQLLFPSVLAIGDLGFGLGGGGDSVRLFDAAGVLYDSVAYDDVAPWPTEPDGQGPTLELIDPYSDNALPQSWRSSLANGTPGN